MFTNKITVTCFICKNESMSGVRTGGMNICDKCANIPLWKAFIAARRACGRRKFYDWKGAEQ
jgi:uncharacterized protein (DUF983 family)